MLGAGDHVGQRRVVDQPHLGEPVQDPVGRVVRHAAATQHRGQFGPTARPAVELLQADPPGHGVRIARELVGVGRDRAAAVLGGPRSGQKSTGTGSGTIGAPAESTRAPMPSFSLIFFSSSSARSGLSRRKLRTFSLPCPSWSFS